MSRNGSNHEIERIDAPTLARRRPLFGQLAEQYLGLSRNAVAECLQRQRMMGGQLGEILCYRGLLRRQHVGDILRMQAQWTAQNLQIDRAHSFFPMPVFLSVCLPAYNEQDSIEDMLITACAILPVFVQRFEIVVVDDGSQDGTQMMVRRLTEQMPFIRLQCHPQNQGYGAAVTTGLRAARGELIFFTDSDGQFGLLDLAQLLVRLEGHDVAIGYRYQRADSPLRSLMAWGWSQLTRLSLGVDVVDLDCAFKLFRREVVDQLRLTARGAAINAEIMAQCAGRRLRICETPVLHYPRCHGAPTGARLRVIWRAFWELPSLRKYRYMLPSRERGRWSLPFHQALSEETVLRDSLPSEGSVRLSREFPSSSAATCILETSQESGSL